MYDVRDVYVYVLPNCRVTNPTLTSVVERTPHYAAKDPSEPPRASLRTERHRVCDLFFYECLVDRFIHVCPSEFGRDNFFICVRVW